VVVAGGIVDLDIEHVIDVGRLLKFPNICRTACYCYNPSYVLLQIPELKRTMN
jgi:hypothetical protein